MRRIREFAGIVLVAAAVTACAGNGPPAASGSSDPPTSAAPAPDVWNADVRAAVGARRVGTPQSCPMPFAFDIAEGWQPQLPAADPRDGLESACAITSAAGQVRVWIGSDSGSSPRGALERFLQGEGVISDPQYRDSPVGKGSGVELTYAKSDAQRGRAFALATPLRTIVVSVGAESPAEYAKVLPGYLLAKESLTAVER
ncbi:lipoprotein [Actinokineospora sp.]|uniref:lipoprotein n=1 Tax=Actinokineospora sp. TaxID=1872133 RepID=UPI0040379161